VAIRCAAVGMAFSTFAGATAARHRQLQQSIWQDQPDRPAADNEVHGLLAATDSLVDAVNTTANALGASRTPGTRG
jgi:hypothetical protein